MLLTFIIIIFLTSWDTNSAHYVLILEKAVNCLPDSVALVNYTYNKATRHGVGYMELTEDIEANSNTLLTIDLQLKEQDKFLLYFKPNFNVTKLDVCVALNTDLMIFPYTRQFVYLEKFCPVKKGVYPFKKHTLHLKNTPILPNGCWNMNFTLERNNKIISCVHIIAQLIRLPQSNV